MPGWLVRVEAGSDRELGVEGELGGVAWQRLGRAAGRKKQGEERRGLGGVCSGRGEAMPGCWVGSAR